MAAQVTAEKVPVSERALVQRINRKLKRDDEQLHRAKGAQTASSVGTYFIVDIMRNCIVHQRVDPEELGRELGVLKPWEALREE